MRKPSPSRLRASITSHLAALRRLGCIVEVTDSLTPSERARIAVKLPTGLTKNEAEEKFVSRNQLIGLVKESEREILRRLHAGKYVEYSAGARRGGGLQLTDRAYQFATQVGSLIYYDPGKTVRVLRLTWEESEIAR